MKADQTASTADCEICARHRGKGSMNGQLVGRCGEFWVYHGEPGADGRAALGHLVIESDRHAPYVADLTDAEAAALGRLRSRVARALQDELAVSFVFTAVIVGTSPTSMSTCSPAIRACLPRCHGTRAMRPVHRPMPRLLLSWRGAWQLAWMRRALRPAPAESAGRSGREIRQQAHQRQAGGKGRGEGIR
jgi:hypothetical protein